MNIDKKLVNFKNIDFKKIIDINNDIIIKIFENIKSQKWKDVEDIIKKLDMDLNIKDSSNVYLLEYVIIFNQINLIDILLKKNIRIDIVDDLNRSILYNVIKFSYIEILIKLLERNKTIIGKSILEIKDKDSNIPLFYAINFFNLECVKIILSYSTNLYIKNNDGNNALHLAIISQNFELFKIVLEKFKDIKSKNINGESCLHLIIKHKCYQMLELIINIYHNNINFTDLLNNVELKYNFTIIHYICIELDYTSLEILSKYNLLKLLNGNIQDYSGNIFYHYFINNIINLKKISFEVLNNIININELIKHINFNINLYNIDGDTSGHLFFNNINFFVENKLNILINWITEKSDMNIQNFQGESVFYLIIKNNYWKKIYNILIKKKIDIFIIAENTIFDFIENKDYDEFIKMITLSYLHQLSKSKSSDRWLEYWDNRCKKFVKYDELNETEIELLKNIGIENNKILNDDNICYQIIFNKIKKSIDNFIENKSFIDASSFPVSNKFKKLISNYPVVVISTFTGSIIDILSGLLYLQTKFNKIKKKYLTTSIKLIENKHTIIYCKDTSDSKLCDIKNFEILWNNKNIFFPSDKNHNIQNLLINLIKNKSDEIRWVIIPIGIELELQSHANYLIVDLENMEIERFEPHGSNSPVGLNYDSALLDKTLIDYINDSGLDFKYFKPDMYLPNIGFQIKEINEEKEDYIGDPNGFCALWCIWWADIRLSNPEISRKKLVKYLNYELINGKISYRKLIRDYSYYIIEIRDKLFLKSNTNINEWINDTLTDKNIDLLNIAIHEEINNI